MITNEKTPLEIRQMLFDKVAKHLLTQKQQAMAVWGVSKEPRCAYRGENGLMCAVGCLISDENYSSDMEGKDPGSLIPAIEATSNANFSDWSSHDLCDMEFMLSRVQAVHDAYDPEFWEDKLKDAAAMCSLEWNHG